jgi:hypothetical protein
MEGFVLRPALGGSNFLLSSYRMSQSSGAKKDLTLQKTGLNKILEFINREPILRS